jgi:hypothetical protein
MLGFAMTYWPAGGAYPFFPGFSPSALPPCMQPPIAMSCYRRTPKPQALPKDFPDYLVYVMREALVATTTSLGKASAETHDAMLRVNQLLAYDRMMRSFFPGMNAWPGGAAPLPFAHPASTAKTASLASRNGKTPAAANQPGSSAADLASLAGMASSATALNAAMSLAAAFLKFTPVPNTAAR